MHYNDGHTDECQQLLNHHERYGPLGEGNDDPRKGIPIGSLMARGQWDVVKNCAHPSHDSAKRLVGIVTQSEG